MIAYVFMPGIGNSEPEHWQSLWAAQLIPNAWVTPSSWNEPECDDWVAALVRDVASLEGKKVLVAHSLGCLAVAQAAPQLLQLEVAGAFLVAVPDVSGPHFPQSAVGFSAAASDRLPFPSCVVASENDPYGSQEHSALVARAWGSQLLLLGALGHINLASNLGEWPEGRRLLDEFVHSVERRAIADENS